MKTSKKTDYMRKKAKAVLIVGNTTISGTNIKLNSRANKVFIHITPPDENGVSINYLQKLNITDKKVIWVNQK